MNNSIFIGKNIKLNIDIESIQIHFGVEEEHLIDWIKMFSLDKIDIEFAMGNLTKRQLGAMVTHNLKPISFLVENPKFIDSLSSIEDEEIKALSQDDFDRLLAVYAEADKLTNEKRGYTFPFDTCESVVLLALRKTKDKNDIAFIRSMESRSFSDGNYTKPRKKLQSLSL